MREVGDVKLMARAVEGIEMKDLKSLADDGKKQLGSGVVAIVGVTEDGKAGVVVGVTADLTARFNAVDLVRVGVRGARRQGRRRPARHGAGRRARWRQGRCGARGDRKSDGRARSAAWRPFRAGRELNDPDLRDRLYELLEHDHLPYSVGSRFVRLIVCVIIIDVLAMILASVPEFDARFGTLFTVDQDRRRDRVRAGICGAALERGRPFAAQTVAGAGPARLCALSLGIIDLLAFLPAAIALIAGQRTLAGAVRRAAVLQAGALFAGDALAARGRFMPSGGRWSAAS